MSYISILIFSYILVIFIVCMPIVFDMAGGVGEFTSNRLEGRFKNYPMINRHLVKEEEYDKHKNWFLKLNAINVAKNNYNIFREYMTNNTNKY